MENGTLSSLMEKADNFLESFDAEVKYSQHKPLTPAERASVAILKVISWQGTKVSCAAEIIFLRFERKRRKKKVTQEVRRKNKGKKKQNEKDSKRKWHIFVLTGRFCCYFIHQVLPVKQT
jgi:hypothetical protein